MTAYVGAMDHETHEMSGSDEHAQESWYFMIAISL